MQNLDVSKTVDTWSSLADTVFVPHTEADRKLITCLTAWLTKSEKTSHTRSLSLMEIVGVLIEKYEDERCPPELPVE